MLRKCLVFAIGLCLAPAAYPQTNAVEASKPALAPVQPPRPNPYDTAGIPDSVKAIVTQAIDSAKHPDTASKTSADSLSASSGDSAAAATGPAADTGPGRGPGSSSPADTSVSFKAPLRVEPGDSDRDPRSGRLFNDPPLIAKEYGFGILGSVVAGALGFYIGSGIETAIVGNSRAHKGTLAFTGIRYDNFQGAFWGGSAGMVLGSAFTTYFVGQTDEENGGLLATLAGTAAAAGGAFYIAHLMGVNDDIDWKPFIPLVALPSIGGTIGFNLSRWFNDRKRESIVGERASIHLHAPRISWGGTSEGNRFDIHAINMTF